MDLGLCHWRRVIWDLTDVVDRPTQLIHIGISICQHTSTKDIAGQSAITDETLINEDNDSILADDTNRAIPSNVTKYKERNIKLGRGLSGERGKEYYRAAEAICQTSNQVKAQNFITQSVYKIGKGLSEENLGENHCQEILR